MSIEGGDEGVHHVQWDVEERLISMVSRVGHGKHGKSGKSGKYAEHGEIR